MKCEGSSQAVEGKNVYACHLEATDLVFQTVHLEMQAICTTISVYIKFKYCFSVFSHWGSIYTA